MIIDYITARHYQPCGVYLIGTALGGGRWGVGNGSTPVIKRLSATRVEDVVTDVLYSGQILVTAVGITQKYFEYL
jgi:hypothetical protein